MKHPMQKIKDYRFVENKIVTYLLDNGGIDLNDIALLGFEAEDRIQFAQLIGYSLSGFGELSYVTDEIYEKAYVLATRKMSDLEAENKVLKEKLVRTEVNLVKLASEFFNKHPDDFTEK